MFLQRCFATGHRGRHFHRALGGQGIDGGHGLDMLARVVHQGLQFVKGLGCGGPVLGTDTGPQKGNLRQKISDPCNIGQIFIGGFANNAGIEILNLKTGAVQAEISVVPVEGKTVFRVPGVKGIRIRRVLDGAFHEVCRKPDPICFAVNLQSKIGKIIQTIFSQGHGHAGMFQYLQAGFMNFDEVFFGQ